MPVYAFLVSTYARNVYLRGVTTLSYIQTNNSAYYIPVQQYAATGIVNGNQYPSGFTGYTDEQLLFALVSGWITQQEYDETIAYRT